MQVRICGECGQALGEGDAVCLNCGAPAGTVCGECGRVIPFGHSSCLNCGAPAEVPPAPAAAPVRAVRAAPEYYEPVSALAVCALVFAFLFPPAGLVLSIVALVSLNGKDRGKCIAALIISIITTTAIGILLAMYLPKLIRMLSSGKRITDFFKSIFG